MNDAQRYRLNAAECLSAAERCGSQQGEVAGSQRTERSDAVEAIAGNKILPKPVAGCNPR
jgi:hypothetical protein